MTMTVHPIRAVLLAGASGSAGCLLASQGVQQARGTATLESLVTAGVVLGGGVAALVIALTALAALAEGLLGWRPRAARALPAPLRRFLVSSVVAAVAAGVAVPAHADEVYPGWVAPVTVSHGASPAPSLASPSPTPAPTMAPEAPEPTPDTTVDAEEPVVELHAESSAPALDAAGAAGVHAVVRGDSLWRIAAHLLGPDATDAAIADAWPEIYQANREVIGDDPGLILPGQVLAIPATVAP